MDSCDSFIGEMEPVRQRAAWKLNIGFGDVQSDTPSPLEFRAAGSKNMSVENLPMMFAVAGIWECDEMSRRGKTNISARFSTEHHPAVMRDFVHTPPPR
jgi:hypothetical protein